MSTQEFSLIGQDCWESMELFNFEQEKEHKLLNPVFILSAIPTSLLSGMFSIFYSLDSFVSLRRPIQLLLVFASSQLAKSLLMQQQQANHFLLRRHITPQWKLLLISFRFIPRICFTLGEVVSIEATPAEIPTDHVPILHENVDPTTIIKQQNFIGTTVINMLRIDKIAATCFRNPFHRMDETKGIRKKRENPQQLAN